MEKDFFIIKSYLSAKIKEYEQLERERNNLSKANLLLNTVNLKMVIFLLLMQIKDISLVFPQVKKRKSYQIQKNEK